ncbi:predicted protein [Sclerotinia sclerotiorum 1980 UF-70]|uniref:Uncharacterized protein n=1 Tax=Sclerotinia sclerotiorum (strain ATCC 18683 / 1980 / Ss-1) TaxID=665079 RepID=A7E734_SCLS1|nr:predicted protein [Sclerotinia sclerotiorum 1980 UF-70]EDN96186.1 predicted protein [Sclerotinia sclerotiorum 1980 UF-70]
MGNSNSTTSNIPMLCHGISSFEETSLRAVWNLLPVFQSPQDYRSASVTTMIILSTSGEDCLARRVNVTPTCLSIVDRLTRQKGEEVSESSSDSSSDEYERHLMRRVSRQPSEPLKRVALIPFGLTDHRLQHTQIAKGGLWVVTREKSRITHEYLHKVLKGRNPAV